jgi:cadmium resistance protein CadD (predicted permease)
MTALPVSAGSAAYVLGVALASLLGANLDTITALAPTLWAARGRAGALRAAVSGCALGNLLIITLAVLAASGLAFTPPSWSRWAGLVPMGIGLWRLRPPQSGAAASGTGGDAGFLGCAVVTLSLGVDNIAVLAPLLRAFSPPRAGAVIAVHLVLFPVLLVAVAAVAARLRGGRRMLAKPIGPCLTIAAGAAVLCRGLLG